MDSILHSAIPVSDNIISHCLFNIIPSNLSYSPRVGQFLYILINILVRRALHWRSLACVAFDMITFLLNFSVITRQKLAGALGRVHNKRFKQNFLVYFNIITCGGGGSKHLWVMAPQLSMVCLDHTSSLKTTLNVYFLCRQKSQWNFGKLCRQKSWPQTAFYQTQTMRRWFHSWIVHNSSRILKMKLFFFISKLLQHLFSTLTNDLLIYINFSSQQLSSTFQVKFKYLSSIFQALLKFTSIFNSTDSSSNFFRPYPHTSTIPAVQQTKFL